MKLSINIILYIFAALNILSGVLQGIYKNIKPVPSITMIISGILLFLSSYYFNIYLLITGLFLGHIAAIYNGYQVNHEIDKTHHFVRLLISLLIIFSMIYELKKIAI